MPKGGLHHIHTTAAPSADFYVKLTYNDFVYFNEREKLFKVAPVFYPAWLIISVERVRRGRVHQVHRHEAFLPLGGGIRSETEGLHQDDALGV